jgi:hypothetical protein
VRTTQQLYDCREQVLRLLKAGKSAKKYRKETREKDFVRTLKSNRLATVRKEDHQPNSFTPIDELPWQEKTLFMGWLNDMPFPALFV